MELLEVRYEQKVLSFLWRFVDCPGTLVNKMSEKGYRLIRGKKCCMNLRSVNRTGKILRGVYRAKIEGQRIRLS